MQSSILTVVALVAVVHTTAAQTTSTVQADIDRLAQAAAPQPGSWPLQPPPAVPEVAVVARHGIAAVPFLMRLLSDDADPTRDPRRWRVQQQVTLVLSRIYATGDHCGRIYCDDDPRGRIAGIRDGWLRVIASDQELRSLSRRELLDRFTREVDWRQAEIGRIMAATGDRSLIAELEGLLTHEDRHVRGNAALVLGRLGDPRGFETIAAILADRSSRQGGQGIPGGRWTLAGQIRADRYYAAHLLGQFRDPRGADLLIPLLDDADVNPIVPWALGQIGDRRAVAPLIAQTERDDPSLRVLTIYGLEQLKAREALPRLRQLLQDNRRARFGEGAPVAEAARRAIAVISQEP